MTSAEEVNALIGMLLLASILKSNDENMESLFSKDQYSRPIFRATMSLNRYKVLVTTLRFDDSQTRDERKKDNKAAAIVKPKTVLPLMSQSMKCLSLFVDVVVSGFTSLKNKNTA